MRPIGEEFMAKTHYEHLGPSDQQRGLPAPPLEVAPDPSQRTVPLPPPTGAALAPADLRELIAQRRSVRRYAAETISQAELAWLLWAAQGVREVAPGEATFRTVPSAGARHALETYILANRIEGLPAGLYRYLAVEHRLAEAATARGIAAALTDACFGQDMVSTCGAAFFWSAVPYRMTWRYGQRGYRYLHLDAGHACQNLYLAAEAVGCGCCAIAAFNDDALNAALGLDGRKQFAIYVATVGKKR